MNKDEMSLDELIADCMRAEQRMSVNNPHRRLLIQCRIALIDLASRVQAGNVGAISVRETTAV